MAQARRLKISRTAAAMMNGGGSFIGVSALEEVKQVHVATKDLKRQHQKLCIHVCYEAFPDYIQVILLSGLREFQGSWMSTDTPDL